MVSKAIVIGIVLTLGTGAVVYGLGVQRKEPITSATIFSLIGATAGLLAITTALTSNTTSGQTAGSLVSGLNGMAGAFR